jgi:hypothetical protein
MSFRPAHDKVLLVIDPAALQMVLSVVTGWLERRERETMAYLIEETGSCGANLGPGDRAHRGHRPPHRGLDRPTTPRGLEP